MFPGIGSDRFISSFAFAPKRTQYIDTSGIWEQKKKNTTATPVFRFSKSFPGIEVRFSPENIKSKTKKILIFFIIINSIEN